MWKLTAWIKRDHNPYLADGMERRMYKGTGDTKNMTQTPQDRQVLVRRSSTEGGQGGREGEVGRGGRYP